MSVQATSWVWQHSESEGTARLVLLAIADAANREGENSYQSVPTIAKMCRISERTVLRKVSELVAIGELVKTGRSGAYGTQTYSIPGVRPDNLSPHDKLGNDMTPVSGDKLSPPDKLGKSTRQTGRNDMTLLSHNPINPSSSKELHPIINNARAREAVREQPRPAPGRINYSPAFEQFWEAYPRKEGKLDAYNAWRAASHLNSASHLIAAAGRYRDNPNRDPRYTKTPTRWLNTRGWEDGPAEPLRPQQPTRVPSWVERAQIAEQVNAQFLANHYQQENLTQHNDWIAGEIQ